MKWFDGILLKMSGPTMGNFIKLIKLHRTGSWVSLRDRDLCDIHSPVPGPPEDMQQLVVPATPKGRSYVRDKHDIKISKPSTTKY